LASGALKIRLFSFQTSKRKGAATLWIFQWSWRNRSLQIWDRLTACPTFYSGAGTPLPLC